MAKYLSDQEIADLASRMRVADPTKDLGAFDSISVQQAAVWLALLGVKPARDLPVPTDDMVRTMLRKALWDSQRLDYLFPGKKLSELKSDKLAIADLKSWPGWRDGHKELRDRRIGMMQMDGFKDAERMNSYVFRHFQTSAFTQMENMSGRSSNPPENIAGAWTGCKILMSKGALDITSDGKKIPFLVFFTTTEGSVEGSGQVGGNMLIMEVLDVKECPWPEPSEKQWEWIRTCQETKFGHDAKGPIVPMLQTPKLPLVIVRYAYFEGRPEGGSQFMLHLEKRVGETMKKNATARQVREKLQWHLQTGEKMPEEHLRMMARLLSSNADLIDPQYVREQQSHWSGVSRDTQKETRISFFVPCLRLRWRALEEIETGQPLKKLGQACNACGKEATKLMCASCKSVYYCSKECNVSNWPSHKTDCKFSQKLSGEAAGKLPAGKFYVGVRTLFDFIPESGFAIEQEAIAQSGGCNIGDCPSNEYGATRFIVRLTMPLDYAVGSGVEKGRTVFIWDRRRSMLLRCGPGDVKTALLRNEKPPPHHVSGHAEVERLVRAKGLQKQLLYLWARRIGDVIEIDLRDIPRQDAYRWE